MKNILLYTFLLTWMLSVSAARAQSTGYKGRMNISPLQLEQIGDSLYIGIDFDLQEVEVDYRRSISLIPILIAPDREERLPEVEIKGRANYQILQRELALMSRAERLEYEQNLPYTILKGYKSKEMKRVLYYKTIAFEPWMKEARLEIRQDLCGCGYSSRSVVVSPLINQVQLEELILPYEITSYLAYVQPEAEAVKRREMVGEAFLDFVVSKTDILPDYMNNPRELKKITDMMAETRNDPSITVKSISVAGYASPEGALKLNKTLSEGRANALVDYLLPRFDYPKSMYHIEFGGENWNGLLDTVNGSQMQYKEQVLAVLTQKEISDEARKTQLKRLLNGEPFRYMLKAYYPSLRKALCKIDYEVKGFDVTQAKEVFKTRPQNLSLNEMYLVANTYEAGAPEFVDVFETAVRLYPNDVTANLNAALAALTRKDIASAERHLDKIKQKASSSEYYNARGVLLMLKGEYNAARTELNRAATAGLDAAKSNLDELAKKIENIELLKKQNR